MKIISVEPYLTPNANSARSFNGNNLRSRSSHTPMIQVELRVFGAIMLQGLDVHMQKHGMNSVGMRLQFSKSHYVSVRRRPTQEVPMVESKMML